MEPVQRKLTLDRPVTYRIRVPDWIDSSWLDCAETVTISVEIQDGAEAVATITCTVDQAALHGLLRRLYFLGLPLISVDCVESV